VISTNQVRANVNTGNNNNDREEGGYFARQEYDRSASAYGSNRGKGNNYRGVATRGGFNNRNGMQSESAPNWRGEYNNRGRGQTSWRGQANRGAVNQRTFDNRETAPQNSNTGPANI